jgi:hypothetical protein
VCQSLSAPRLHTDAGRSRRQKFNFVTKVTNRIVEHVRGPQLKPAAASLVVSVLKPMAANVGREYTAGQSLATVFCSVVTSAGASS